MVHTLLIVVHVIVCIALIMIVLLQTGKGADMGAAFGGGSSQTLFGSGGASTFLSKATTMAAIVFMLTSLFLAYMSSDRSTGSVISDTPAPVTDEAKPSQPDQTTTDAETQDQTTAPNAESTDQNTATDENSPSTAPSEPEAGETESTAEETSPNSN